MNKKKSESTTVRMTGDNCCSEEGREFEKRGTGKCCQVGRAQGKVVVPRSTEIEIGIIICTDTKQQEIGEASCYPAIRGVCVSVTQSARPSSEASHDFEATIRIYSH